MLYGDDLGPARPFRGAGEYPLEAGNFDEAFAATGAPRHPYAELLDALARQDLKALRERVRSNVAAAGLAVRPGREIAVDPVPRLIDGGGVGGAARPGCCSGRGR